MRRSKAFPRWLTAWLLLCMLGVGLWGGTGLAVRAAPKQANALDVIINEIAWGGTAASATDEWIELYNPGSTDIDLAGWTLNAVDGTPSINLNGVIPAGGYFLLERTDDTTISDLAANLIYTGALSNTVETLELRDNNSNLIDTANQGGAAWFAGTAGPDFFSMERVGVVPDGPTAWASNDGVTRNGLDANGMPINGTPTNSVPSQVIISEVAWAGTKAYSGDEWIELYNTGSQTILLNNWILTNTSGTVYISFDATDSIGPGGFFLIERGSGNATSEAEQKTYSTGSLSDSGDTLHLLNSTRQEVDTANMAGGPWPAGGGANFSSMERVVRNGIVSPDGPYAWITNVGTVRNGQDAAGNDIYGTPGRPNWAFNVTPTFTPTITPSPTPTSTPAPTAALSVVINEVAWAGTQSSSDDEWIELYNPTNKDINLTGWRLVSATDGSPDIKSEFNGIILGAGKYLLLERTDDDPTNVKADVIYTGSLSNTGEILRLYDQNGFLVDSANSNGGLWPAGNASNFSSMQRSVIAADSDFVWVTYDLTKDTGTKAKDASGNDIKGTPGRANVPINVTPTVTPKATSRPAVPGSTAVGNVVLQPVIGISEFLPRPGHDWNNDGVVDVGDEFIEIINAGPIDINLSAYRLDDEQDSGSPPYTLPSLTLKPNERAVFYGSETGILLSDAGDTVRLLRGSTVVDAYTYGPVRAPDQSWCRLPDRMGYWNDPCFPTPNNPNALTGTIPLPPDQKPVYQPPLCLLPDTTPEEFVYAECEVGGQGIWNRQFWDSEDASRRLNLDEGEKWETTLE